MDHLGLDKLIIHYLLTCDKCRIKIINMKLIFVEHNLLYKDVYVDIPRIFDIYNDKLYWNVNNNIITFSELIQLVKKGGAQTYSEWLNIITKKANSRPINGIATKISDYYIIINNYNSYEIADKRDKANGLLDTVNSNYKWGVYTTIIVASGKNIGNIVNTISLTNSFFEELQIYNQINQEFSNNCTGIEDLEIILKNQTIII